MAKNTLKTVGVTAENYQKLKNCGTAGDSFNDVISDLLELREKRTKEGN